MASGGLYFIIDFLKQLNLIKTAFTNGCVILGDFNLDYKMRHDINYPRANYFNLFDDVLGDLNLMQLVDFPTWSRLVGLSWRTSVLDHIYVNNIILHSVKMKGPNKYNSN